MNYLTEDYLRKWESPLLKSMGFEHDWEMMVGCPYVINEKSGIMIHFTPAWEDFEEWEIPIQVSNIEGDVDNFSVLDLSIASWKGNIEHQLEVLVSEIIRAYVESYDQFVCEV